MLPVIGCFSLSCCCCSHLQDESVADKLVFNLFVCFFKKNKLRLRQMYNKEALYIRLMKSLVSVSVITSVKGDYLESTVGDNDIRSIVRCHCKKMIKLIRTNKGKRK